MRFFFVALALSACYAAVDVIEDPHVARLTLESNGALLYATEPFHVDATTDRVDISIDGVTTQFAPGESQSEGVWIGKHGDESVYIVNDALIQWTTADVERQLRQIDALTYELTTLEEAVHDGDDTSLVESIASEPTSLLAAGTPHTITVAFAYTPAALAKIGSETLLVSQFKTGLARMNEALKNSNLNVRVVLGQVVPVAYTEPATMSQIVSDMQNRRVPDLPRPSDGNNKTLLAAVCADPNYAGWAQVPGAFTAVKAPFLSTLLVAHELGHTLDALHVEGFQFANGHHTIMLPKGNLGREPIYSNPNIMWLGERAGSGTSFNARRICNKLALGSACWIAQAGETIIDNRSAATSSSGSWPISTATGAYGQDSVYSNSGTFRFSPAITTAGSYDVYAWWTYHTNRSTNVPHTIKLADGTLRTVTKNQRDPALAGKWVSLGTFTLGSGSYVQVSAANGQACADAVRFVAR